MFGRMKIYTVHVKPGTVNPYERPVFVREGFNFFAFLFTFFWALFHRLWMQAIGILLINIALMMLVRMHVMSADGIAIVQLAMNVMIGFVANDWLRAHLSKRGYIVADISAADNLLRAEQRYFERTIAAAH